MSGAKVNPQQQSLEMADSLYLECGKKSSEGGTARSHKWIFLRFFHSKTFHLFAKAHNFSLIS